MAYQGPNGNLSAPAQHRRVTSPVRSLSSISLSLPDNQRKAAIRPPSPLRQGFVADTGTGIDLDAEDDEDDDDDDDDDPRGRGWRRSPSPASSTVSGLAASFVQRVNNFVGGMAPRSPLPSDAELEAEAEQERERSRKEAEAILMRENRQRKQLEDRVLEMIDNAKSLPPPPARSQTMPNPPSPASSQKESTSWWSAAKSRLTPTKDKDKEPLTPAQQVIQDAKAREKDKKNAKGKDKGSEWPAVPHSRSDSNLGNLAIPVAPPTRKPVPTSPVSPTPSRPSLTNMPPNLTPSPMRTTDSLASSPSREAPPLYAQFNAQGALDVPTTLLTIAKRFEKLEKWTVGHVRALEDRMNDVERWLVDKEKEKDDSLSMKSAAAPSHEVREMRDQLSELQSRMGEMGREMAKMASKVQTVPQTTTVVAQNHTGSSIPTTPHHRRSSNFSAVEPTSPPLPPFTSNKTPSGTRLPYPQGDYTSPPDAFSPPNSPPGSLTKATRSSSIISGLPATSSGFYSTSGFGSTSSLSLQGALSNAASAPSPTPQSAAPSTNAPAMLTSSERTTSPSPLSGTAGSTLPPPRPSPATQQRQTSVSPTPRKRYTVALGGPIVAPDDDEDEEEETVFKPPRKATPKRPTKDTRPLGDDDDDNSDDDDEEDGMNEETIGKSMGSKLIGSLSGLKSAPVTLSSASSREMNVKKEDTSAFKKTASEPSPMSNRRLRAQSAYGFSSIPGANAVGGSGIGDVGSTKGSSGIPSVAPLKLRSKSSERLNAGSPSGGPGGLNGNGTWVDPLILRRQSRDNMKPIAMPKPVGKVPVGQLVAFFDKDKKP